MNDLSILIARLGWPTTSARWWTMQELAVRLGESATKMETESALLQLLRSNKLEAEVLEVLSIFWMAATEFDYSPTVELAKNILKLSPLSDLLMKNFGLPLQARDMNLKKVSEDFEIPEDFLGMQGVDVPRIFLTSISQLEGYSKLPFIQQMAFEWMQSREAHPDAPYQCDPRHFVRSLGDGFVCSFSARPALRTISAYLRTLAVARQFWKMPPEVEEQMSLLALPVHPTLALLKPCQPDWLPSPTDFDGDADAIEASLCTLLARMEAMRPGDELIAFSSPVMMSRERCVEVSLVRWSKTSKDNVETAALADHLKHFWEREQMLSSKTPEPLSTTTIIVPPALEHLIDKNCWAWPLAGTLDYNRIGYLQQDLYPSRLFVPTMPGVDKVEILPHGGQLQAKVKGQVIADLCYWNVGWGPARPVQMGGNCGTALISHGTKYREGIKTESRSVCSFYLWQVRTLQKNDHFREFNEALATGIICI